MFSARFLYERFSPGTTLETIKASTCSSPNPRSRRRPAETAPSSSAVRFPSVVILQRPRSSSPSKSPSTVCVLPMSTAINKLQALLKLSHATRVRPCQKSSYRTAPRNKHVGREIPEPFEIEGPRDTRMRHDEIRPFYNLFAEEQDINIYRTRSLLPGRYPDATEGHLDSLAEAQELDRRRPILDLDYAVQVIRLLLTHLYGRRLVDLRDAAHREQWSPPERPDRRSQVTQPIPEVAPQAQEGPGH